MQLKDARPQVALYRGYQPVEVTLKFVIFAASAKNALSLGVEIRILYTVGLVIRMCLLKVFVYSPSKFRPPDLADFF